MWPFAVVIGQNVSGAFYSLLSRRLSVKLPQAQFQVSAALYTITYSCALAVAFSIGHVYAADLREWWPYLLIGGSMMALNGVSILLVFRYMDAAMGSLLMTINIVMAVISAMYVLGEHMGVQELVGAITALAAVVYALSVHVSKRERRNWTLGIVFTLVSAACFAVSSVIEKFLLGEMHISSYLAWGFGSQWLVAVVLGVCIGGYRFKQVFARRNLALMVGAGLTRSGMAILFVTSIVMLKSLCIAVVLAGLRPLFVSFLGAWILGERKFMLRKIIASIIAGAGVSIMFW